MSSAALTPDLLEEPLAALADAPAWYVGFSGGVDSTALLHLLAQWRKRRADSPPLVALHVNHGLQADASQWQNHCAWISRMLGIPCRALPARVEPRGRGVEAAAREARYAAFAAELEPGAVLFLAHHLDDQVETLFLRLLRGAGVDGLAAMPRSRALGEGRLYRPLLDVARADLAAYVARHGLSVIEDPSNADAGLDRNYLRHRVMPLLEARWPGYRQTVARAAAHLASASEQLAAATTTLAPVHSVAGDPGVPVDALLALPPPEAARALRRFLQSLHLSMPDQSALDELLRQLRESGAAAAPELDCGSYRLTRYRDALYLRPALLESPSDPVDIRPGQWVVVPGVGQVGLERAEDGFWLAADECLTLRFRRGGERCRPVGRGRGAGLKKLLQETGLPPWWRPQVPLLVLEGELLAVGAVGPCHSSRWQAAGHDGEAPWVLRWKPGSGDAAD